MWVIPTLKLSCAGAMLIASIVTDLRTKKVPNALVLGILACSLVLVIALDGPRGLPDALISFASAAVSILPLYFMRALGGGDVKVFVAISPLLQWKFVLIMLFSSLVWGSILGITQAVIKGQGKVLANNMLGIFLKNKPRSEDLHKIPYTVALFFGFLTSISVGGLL